MKKVSRGAAQRLLAGAPTIPAQLAALPLVARTIGNQMGVKVVMTTIATGATDGKTIWLPEISSATIVSFKRRNKTADFMSLLFGLLDHEAAHCRYTDFSVDEKEVAAAAGLPYDLVHSAANWFEDVWIEYRLPLTFPGTRQTLATMNEALLPLTKEQLTQLPEQAKRDPLSLILFYLAANTMCTVQQLPKLNRQLATVQQAVLSILPKATLETLEKAASKALRSLHTRDNLAIAVEVLCGLKQFCQDQRAEQSLSGGQGQGQSQSQGQDQDQSQGQGSGNGRQTLQNQMAGVTPSGSTDKGQSLRDLLTPDAPPPPPRGQGKGGTGAGSGSSQAERQLGAWQPDATATSLVPKLTLTLERHLLSRTEAHEYRASVGSRLETAKLAATRSGDFKIYRRTEEGEDISLACVLCVDMSGSMEGSRDNAVSAVLALGRALSALNKALDGAESIDLGVVSFHRQAKLLKAASPGWSRRDEALIQTMAAAGGTKFLPALNAAVRAFDSTIKQRKIVFLLTDGYSNEEAIELRYVLGTLESLGIEVVPVLLNMETIPHQMERVFGNGLEVVASIDKLPGALAKLMIWLQNKGRK